MPWGASQRFVHRGLTERVVIVIVTYPSTGNLCSQFFVINWSFQLQFSRSRELFSYAVTACELGGICTQLQFSRRGELFFF